MTSELQITTKQPNDFPVRAVIYVAIAAACLLMAWLGIVVRRPYLVADGMMAENRTLEKQANEIKIRNQRLRKEVAALQTPQGMEREARRLGFVKKNEVPLVIPQ